jgi:hypothetical protein
MTERKQKRGHEEMVSVLLSQAVTKVAKAIPHAVDLGHTVSVNELNEIILHMQGIVARFTSPVQGSLIDSSAVFGNKDVGLASYYVASANTLTDLKINAVGEETNV